MGKTDEESADDSEDKDDKADDKDDSKDDDSADDKDDDSADDKDDKADDKEDDKADDKDDDSADDKDDDSDDDKDAKQSLAKTDSKAKDAKSDAKADKADDKDDDSDDDKDDSDDADDDTPEDGAVTADVQVGEDADDACRCVTACNKAQKPICFVNSASCKLKANCDKGAKGNACIKQDPVKGPWTFCSNVINNGTAAPKKEEKESLLPENPNVAVALRMLADVKREILGVTQEDSEGARKLREAYRDEKATEEHKRKEVLDQQHDLEDAQEDDLARKQKLTDEVHALQDKNKSLRRQVDRIGEFLKSESSKLSDAVTTAKTM